MKTSTTPSLLYLCTGTAARRRAVDTKVTYSNHVEQHDLTAFDAYHVACADEDPIVSSDASFDDVTDERVPIEESPE